MTYEIRTTVPGLTYPGCARRDATCATREEAEAAIASLVATGEWDADDLEIVEVTSGDAGGRVPIDWRSRALDAERERNEAHRELLNVLAYSRRLRRRGVLSDGDAAHFARFCAMADEAERGPR